VSLPSYDFRTRIAGAAAGLAAAGADALLVSHLANLRYLSGLEVSAGHGLLTAAGCLYLLVDARYQAAARAQADLLGSDVLIAVDTTDRRAASWIAEHCVREGIAHLRLESRVLPLHEARTLERALATAAWAGTLVDTPLDLVEGLRRVKDRLELLVLSEGGARLSDVARGVLGDGVARAGHTELDVAAEIDRRVRAAGFSRAAFETIVASGPRSALPHARPTDRRLDHGDVVVLDFGGVYGGYCVDLTRTVCLGQPSAEVDRQYWAVRAAQEAGCAAVGPGVSPADVDRAARQVLEAAGFGAAFAHGTGHGLGLEVHEAPRLARPLPDDATQPPLEAGVVCTIEPGAYLTGRAGIRIEDDVVVTADGHRAITDVPLGWPTAH